MGERDVYTMKFEIVETNEIIATQGGNLLLGAIMKKTELEKRVNSILGESFPPPQGIKTSDVIISYIGTLSQAQPEFEAIEQFRKDPYFKETLGLDKVPSCSTLRQRIDSLGETAKDETIEIVLKESCALLHNREVQISPCFKDYVPLDVDVSPFDNSKTKKEGIGFTYKKFMGYAPIFAYLGQEGYCVNVELREGQEHCQNKTPEFLESAINNAQMVTNAKILVRLDSGNDSRDNIALFQKRNVDFIIKRNPRKESVEEHFHNAEKTGLQIEDTREGKRIFVYETLKTPNNCKKAVRVVTFATERTITASGQILLLPEYEIESYYTSLSVETATSNEVQNLYHDHGTSEQFHSEIKTDLDLERLPSGKFATNAIVLALGIFSYNLLRLIGQESLKSDDFPPTKHKVSRRRVRTVIDRYISLAVKMVSHARKRFIKIWTCNPCLSSFRRIYRSFAV